MRLVQRAKATKKAFHPAQKELKIESQASAQEHKAVQPYPQRGEPTAFKSNNIHFFLTLR